MGIKNVEELEQKIKDYIKKYYDKKDNEEEYSDLKKSAWSIGIGPARFTEMCDKHKLLYAAKKKREQQLQKDMFEYALAYYEGKKDETDLARLRKEAWDLELNFKTLGDEANKKALILNSYKKEIEKYYLAPEMLDEYTRLKTEALNSTMDSVTLEQMCSKSLKALALSSFEEEVRLYQEKYKNKIPNTLEFNNLKVNAEKNGFDFSEIYKKVSIEMSNPYDASKDDISSDINISEMLSNMIGEPIEDPITDQLCEKMLLQYIESSKKY